MTLLIILLSIAAYLAMVAAGIATAGHFYGKAKIKLTRLSKWNYTGSGKNPDWVKWNAVKETSLIGAFASAIWPVAIGLALVAGTVGSIGWVFTVGVKKLFLTQSAKAITLEQRREEMAAQEHKLAIQDKKAKVFA